MFFFAPEATKQILFYLFSFAKFLPNVGNFSEFCNRRSQRSICSVVTFKYRTTLQSRYNDVSPDFSSLSITVSDCSYFSNIHVLRGSVATRFRCGGIVTTRSLSRRSVKEFSKSVSIWWKYRKKGKNGPAFWVRGSAEALRWVRSWWLCRCVRQLSHKLLQQHLAEQVVNTPPPQLSISLRRLSTVRRSTYFCYLHYSRVYCDEGVIRPVWNHPPSMTFGTLATRFSLPRSY